MAMGFWRHGRIVMAALVVLSLAACDSVEERIEKHYARGMTLNADGDPKKAALEFRNALKLNENHAPSRFEIGKLYEQDREIQAAVSNYRLVAELAPDHLGARVRLAQLLLLANQADDAARFAGEAVAIAPQDADALSVLAAVQYRRGEVTEARANLDRALEADPAHVSAHALLASDRVNVGDHAGALAILDRRLAATPDDLTFNLLKARVLEGMDDQALLGAHMKRLVEIYPEQTSFRQALAQWHLRQGDTAAAEAELQAIVARNPADIEAATLLTRFVLSSRGVEAAGEDLRRRIAAIGDPEATFPLELLAAELETTSGDLAAARARLEALVEKRGETSQGDEARVRLAALIARQGDPAGARALVDGVLARDPRNTEALALRGGLRIEALETAEAVRDLRTAVELDPDNPRLLLLLAQAYQRDGALDLAIDRLAAAARVSKFAPDYAGAYARALVGAGRPDAAATALTEAVRRNPTDRTLLATLAELRLRLEDWAGAEEVATQLAALDGSAATVSQIRAASLSGQGRFGESIDVLERLSADPAQDQAAMTGLVGAYVRNGEVERAKSYLDEALGRNPANPRALLLRAELDLIAGETGAAEARLRDLIAAAPQASAGHTGLMQVLIRQGRFDDALAVGEQGVAAVAGDGQALRLLMAQIHEQRGDFDAAIAAYRNLFEIAPGSDVIANNLAALLSDHRADDPESVALATRVAQRLRSATVPEFQDTYGWVRYLAGDYDGALRSLLPAAEARPENPWIQFHTGMALSKIGRTAEARERLTATLAIDPAFPRRAEVEATLAALP